MSVYARKRKNGEKAYYYDFVIKGARFLSPTSYPTRKAAEAAERNRKIKIAEGRDDVRETLTLDEAAGRYWEDVGQHRRSARDIERNIDTLLRLIGKNTRIVDIRFATINAAIQKRRKELSRKHAGQAKPLSNATINREFLGQLRPILNHAAETFELPITRIAWRKLRLQEGSEIVREFSGAEIERWAAELSWVETVFLGIALTYGPRFGEMFFPPESLRVNAPGGPEIELGRYVGAGGEARTSRKDGSTHTIMLSEEHALLLAHLAERAKAAGLDVIWFDETPAGLQPIGYAAMRGRLLRAAKRAGIEPGRIIHGMRHHAATQLLRRTNNLVLAQRALGHKQISTTRRYAHVANKDLRAGLADVSRHSPVALTPALPKPDKNQTEK